MDELRVPARRRGGAIGGALARSTAGGPGCGNLKDGTIPYLFKGLRGPRLPLKPSQVAGSQLPQSFNNERHINNVIEALRSDLNFHNPHDIDIQASFL